MKNKKEFSDFDRMTREGEAAFWDSADMGDYVESGEAQVVRGVYRPRHKDRGLSFKTEDDDFRRLRELAEDKGIGHTTLLRRLLKYCLKHQDDISLV